MLKSALLYAKFGWAVFPVSPNSKIPYKGTSGCKDATKNEDKLVVMFKDKPACNLALATGAYSGVFVIDIDNKNDNEGEKSLHILQQKYGELPITVTAITPSGGRHLFFKAPEGIRIGNSTSMLGTALDVRGHGGYVLLSPSKIDGKEYTWVAEQDPFSYAIADAPQWLLELVQDTKPIWQVDLAGKDRIIDDGNRNARLFQIACVARNMGLKDYDSLFAYVKGVNMTSCRPPKSDEVVATIVKSSLKYEDKKQEISKDNDEVIYWDKTDTGTLKSTYRNVLNFYKTDPMLGELKYNEFSHQISIITKPFWIKNWHGEKLLDDNDLLQMKQYLSTQHFQPSLNTLVEAVQTVSYNRRFHPVREYLDGLKWDGNPRIETFFTEIMSCPDDPYYRFVSKLFFLSAVKRIYHPGCKYDYMIILEGAQGIGKSMALRYLGGEWFSEVSLTDRDRDTIDKIQGKWICEVAEMQVFQVKDIEALKSFLSTQVDRTRLAYARTTKDFPRQSIFVGTINPDTLGYLRDMTGNRRFLPVECGSINFKQIPAIRDQLFAEAVHLVKNGAEIYLPPDIEKLAKEHQDSKVVIDPWEPIIMEYLNNPLNGAIKEVTIADIWQHCFNAQPDKLTRKEQIRIAKVLIKNGYVCVCTWEKGTGKTVRVYRKETEEAEW